ncbi:unnamed protein product [Phytomonas sp. Hart1]|nr:unnamed protein product [Phytomonas sp. Hart1]|eukprot:CCW66058.1 unnamed protein product [Phytomonas sp. isolate Hart1]
MQLDVDPRMAGHFVKTDTEVGLTDASVGQAQAILAALPDHETALRRAQYALADPEIKDEEIAILTIQRDQLQAKANALEASLKAQQAELESLATTRQKMERELKDRRAKMEDMEYRLALAEFSKKNNLLSEALAFAATTSGKERKEVDARIKSLVTLLRSKKEVEKTIKSENRKTRKISVEAT